MAAGLESEYRLAYEDRRVVGDSALYADYANRVTF